MDLTMNIASMSVAMSSAQTAQSLGLATLKMAMDSSTEAVEALLADTANAVSIDPNLGANLDVSV